ncbi:sporulation-delaying protein SdpB family protein [Amycolatopsis sp. NPDC051758]|uniref:sporulation-delaying protein SdpB family protein n=1 Tax=Amycolatopsis sp. NPDC051758 TaxID=3363935 RepID=UPI0037A61B29
MVAVPGSGRERAVRGPVSVRSRLGSAIDRHEPRSVLFAVGRSVLAGAQLSVLLFNSDTTLFADSPAVPGGVRCGGLRSVSLWCLLGDQGVGPMLARAVAIATLVVVLIGAVPRWTCIPHWYVNFSLAAAMPLSNGGDRAAEIAALLLIPICLGDDRKWQWNAVREPLPAWFRGSSQAGALMLRVQVAVIYLVAATAKLSDPAWVHGRALGIVASDPEFGFPMPVRAALEPLLASDAIVAPATWTVIAVQYMIVVAIMGGRRWRALALVLGSGLHLAIAVLLGLPSFGLTMIALLLCAANPAGPAGARRQRWSPWSQRKEEARAH